MRGATTRPLRPAGDNGFHVNEIFINADLFIGKKISAGGPQEITLTCQAVATFPASFSIKQANNTIPTPINKSAFQNKVQYTGSLQGSTSLFYRAAWA